MRRIGNRIKVKAIDGLEGHCRNLRPEKGRNLTQNSIDLRGRVGTGAQPA